MRAGSYRTDDRFSYYFAALVLRTSTSLCFVAFIFSSHELRFGDHEINQESKFLRFAPKIISEYSVQDNEETSGEIELLRKYKKVNNEMYTYIRARCSNNEH